MRILIYARGTQHEITEQQAQCYAAADTLGPHQIVSLASDPPGGSDGWISANNMVHAGEVDRILISSREVIPVLPFVESVTRSVASPLRSTQEQQNPEPSWKRRPRRLRDFKRR